MDFRLIAIVRDVDPAMMEPVAHILQEAGITSVEVSLSEPVRGFGCLEALKALAPGLRVGAGTVSAPEQVDRLLDLGVGYFLTPGVDTALIRYALARDLEVIPGVLTPSDVQAAVNLGLKTLKLFPAGAMPHSYIGALKGPFPDTEYLAVGGVGADTIPAFMAAGFCGAGIGGSLVPRGAGPDRLEDIRSAALALREAVRRGEEGQGV